MRKNIFGALFLGICAAVILKNKKRKKKRWR